VTPPLSRQEIYAAAAAHDELGPVYSDAVTLSLGGVAPNADSAR